MTRNCDFCGQSYAAQRPTSKFCSSTCRGKNSRGDQPPVAAVSAPVDPGRPVAGLVDAVSAELEALGRLDSVTGQHALELANRIVSAPGMNAGVAALSKELSRVLVDARGSSAVVDPVDELGARRDAKLKRAAG